MLYVLHGADAFTVHEALRQVIASHQPADASSAEAVTLDGATVTPSQILAACQQISLLSSSRVVVVDGLLARFEADKPTREHAKKGKSKRTGLPPEWGGFASLVASLPDESVLLLVDGELKPGNHLLQTLAKAPGAVIREMRPPRGDILVTWIRERSAAAGAPCDEEAARRLGLLAGGDLWQLNSELQKLAAYANGRAITAAMVEALTANSASSTIFSLVDAIVEGRQKDARLRLDQLYRDGLSAGYVFTMVGRQVRLIAQIVERRQHSGTVQPAVELSGLHEFVLRRATDQARKFDQARIQKVFEVLIPADRSIKTGICTERIALEQMITDLLPTLARR